MAIYSKDKTVRINVRISAEQACFLDKLSQAYDRPISEVVRMVLDSYMWGYMINENKQSNIDDQL